jgi:hypothetical protein
MRELAKAIHVIPITIPKVAGMIKNDAPAIRNVIKFIETIDSDPIYKDNLIKIFGFI